MSNLLNRLENPNEIFTDEEKTAILTVAKRLENDDSSAPRPNRDNTNE